MLINYVLIAYFSTGEWTTMRIAKPHMYVTECYEEGHRWKQEHVHKSLAAGKFPSMTWECKRVAR